MKVETKETIEPANDFLKSRDVVKVGSLKRYEIKPSGDTPNSVEVTDWTVTRYYKKDGTVDENLGGCTITIANSVCKRVAKAIGES